MASLICRACSSSSLASAIRPPSRQALRQVVVLVFEFTPLSLSGIYYATSVNPHLYNAYIPSSVLAKEEFLKQKKLARTNGFAARRSFAKMRTLAKLNPTEGSVVLCGCRKIRVFFTKSKIFPAQCCI